MISRLDTQTNIRLPAELKRALVDAAADNRRSLSAEIEERLTSSFSAGERAGGLESLQRAFEQLMEVQKNDNQKNVDFLRHVLLMYNQTLRALDEAILMAQHKNGRQEDLQRMREEFDQARGALKAFDAVYRSLGGDKAS